MKYIRIKALLLLMVVQGCADMWAANADSLRRGQFIMPDVPGVRAAERYDYFLLEAVRLRQKKDYAAAFDLLQHCLRLNPQGDAAHYELAQYYMSLNDSEKAGEHLLIAAKADSTNYWYANAVVNYYTSLHETEKAIATLEEMSARFPGETVLYRLVELYARQNNYEQLIATLNRLEKKFGKSEQVSMLKFRTYQQQGNVQKALQAVEELVKEYPYDLRYKVNLGDAYLQNGEKEKALRTYQEVLDKDPYFPPALFSMANFYQHSGDRAKYLLELKRLAGGDELPAEARLSVLQRMLVEAEQQPKEAERIKQMMSEIVQKEEEETQIPLLYAQYLYSKGVREQAKDPLKKAIEIGPKNKAARLMLVSIAAEQEDYQAIVSICTEGIAALPKAVELYYYLCIAYNHAERYDDALSACQKALTVADEQTPAALLSDFYAMMGDIHHMKGRDAAAYVAYDRALEYNPDNVPALNNYAYYLSLEGKELDKAESMSHKTIKAEPTNDTYLDTYAWILFLKGNFEQAKIYIESALKNGGSKNGVLVEHCGDIYYKLGEREKALEMWKKAQKLGEASPELGEKIKQKRYINPAKRR